MDNMETAYRAAGYVVMAMLWGAWRVDRVSLADMGSSEAGIEYAPLTEIEGKDLWQRFGTRLFDARLQRMMGGPVAQSLLLGSEVRYRGETGESEFDTMVSVIQDGMPGSSLTDAWGVIHEHEPVVQADLKRMWYVVEALAGELTDKRELADYQIRSIVRTAVNQLPEEDRSWAIARLRNTPSHS